MESIYLKQRIIKDLDLIEQNEMLWVVWQFIDYLKAHLVTPTGNIRQVMGFASCLSDKEANELRHIQTQFNTIEGDW